MLEGCLLDSMVTTGGGDRGTQERESLCLAVAEWAAAGFAIILIRPDGSKAPLTKWKTIAEGSQPPPTVESLTDQIRKGLCDGIAVVTGVASGNAEMIELEGRAAERLDEIVMHAEATGVGHLLERLLSGCVEASPSGGMHFVFRVTDGPARGNTSLACRPDPTEPRGRLVLAETRGQGGYMIVAASFGRTHATGKPYAFLEGSPANTPTFTAAERDELHRLFRVIDEMPVAVEEEPHKEGRRGRDEGISDDDGRSPGDDFNYKATWDEVLPGWTRVATSPHPDGGVRVHWRRPGKTLGSSATTGGEGDWLFVFSTSTELPPEKALSKFAAFTYLNHGGDFGAAAAELVAQGFGTREEKVGGQRQPLQRYEPFPTDCLPAVLRDFIEAGATAASCDAAHIALPALAGVASAIGMSRQLKLKSSWRVPSILWTATVGDSGSKKSVGSGLALGPIEAIESQNERRFNRECRQHERQLNIWERETADWKRSKSRGPAPEKPESPASRRVMLDNATIEALAPLLKANPRGLLLAKDELKAWLGSFDRYAGSGTSGSDESHWLSTYNGRPMLVDRKTGKYPTIHVPRAAVSITGNIPPGILKRSMNKERRESGLAARFLMACPPRQRVQWTEATIPTEIERTYRMLFEELYKLQPLSFSDGEMQPVDVELNAEAKALFTAFYNQHNEEQLDLVGDLAAVWSKMEETAARIALVVHMVRSCSGEEGVDPGVLDETSMASGIRLATWFKNEMRRVYAILGESELEEENRRLVEWVCRNGGVTSVREVQQKCRWLKEPGRAEKALQSLVGSGLGTWESTQAEGGQRGRPGQRFVLADGSCLQ